MLTASHAPALPDRTDVVIIGGGVVGVSAALLLAESGIETLLLEKGRIAGEQSSRNWGWIRKQGRDPAEIPLMLESARLWQRLAGELDTDIGYRQGGSTYVATEEDELAVHCGWLKSAGQFGLDSRVLSAAETDRLLDQSDRRFVGALHTPSDACAEPSLAVPALARLARHKGAIVCENTAVRTLLIETGSVCGVVTEHGTVRANGVVLAGGVWSRCLLENEGFALPQLAVRASALRTTGAPSIGSSTFGAPGASIRQRLDGGYTIGRVGAARVDLVPAAFRYFRAFLPMLHSRWRVLKIRAGAEFFGPLGRHRWHAEQRTPFEQVRTMDPAPDDQLLEQVLSAAQQLYPQLSKAQSIERWAGLIDVTPDEVAVIGAYGGLPNLVVATGLSGHGFGLGPGAGRLAVELLTGTSPCVDPEPLSLDRFAGSRGRVTADKPA